MKENIIKSLLVLCLIVIIGLMGFILFHKEFTSESVITKNKIDTLKIVTSDTIHDTLKTHDIKYVTKWIVRHDSLKMFDIKKNKDTIVNMPIQIETTCLSIDKNYKFAKKIDSLGVIKQIPDSLNVNVKSTICIPYIYNLDKNLDWNISVAVNDTLKYYNRTDSIFKTVTLTTTNYKYTACIAVVAFASGILVCLLRK